MEQVLIWLLLLDFFCSDLNLLILLGFSHEIISKGVILLSRGDWLSVKLFSCSRHIYRLLRNISDLWNILVLIDYGSIVLTLDAIETGARARMLSQSMLGNAFLSNALYWHGIVLNNDGQRRLLAGCTSCFLLTFFTLLSWQPCFLNLNRWLWCWCWCWCRYLRLVAIFDRVSMRWCLLLWITNAILLVIAFGGWILLMHMLVDIGLEIPHKVIFAEALFAWMQLLFLVKANYVWLVRFYINRILLSTTLL